MSLYTYWPTRTLVRTVACPYCRATPGARCIGARGEVREANHGERITAFTALWRPS
jgi:hypothetical protein